MCHLARSLGTTGILSSSNPSIHSKDNGTLPLFWSSLVHKLTIVEILYILALILRVYRSRPLSWQFSLGCLYWTRNAWDIMDHTESFPSSTWFLVWIVCLLYLYSICVCQGAELRKSAFLYYKYRSLLVTVTIALDFGWTVLELEFVVQESWFRSIFIQDRGVALNEG